jgi:hypothetical protein
MEGGLVPVGQSAASNAGAAGYNAGRDRGANAAANRMRTLPQVTRRWWVKEFEELKGTYQNEEKVETAAAFKLAAERSERCKENSSNE